MATQKTTKSADTTKTTKTTKASAKKPVKVSEKNTQSANATAKTVSKTRIK